MNGPPAIINVAVIALTVFLSYMGFVNPRFLNRYLFSSQEILRARQYERLISAGALHANLAHLIFNMYSLYSFGSAVELYVGPATFLITYLAGIVGGNLFALLLHRKEDYHALGASGGVCGIIYACIFLLPGSSVTIMFIPVAIPAYIYAILFMLFSYYGIRSQKGNIGHDAHLGGAIIGLLAATAMHPSIVPANPVLYPVVMLLAVAILVLLYVNPLRLIRERQLKRIKAEDELFTFKRHQ
jgi:membrane associated rhomboid family serine protease